jgi:hypothetical protein
MQPSLTLILLPYQKSVVEIIWTRHCVGQSMTKKNAGSDFSEPAPNLNAGISTPFCCVPISD